MDPIPNSWKRRAPLPATDFPIVAESAGSSDAVLLPTVGNSQHLGCDGTWIKHRDDADARIIAQYQSQGSGGFWPNGITATGSAALPIPAPAAPWQDRPVLGGAAVYGITAMTEFRTSGRRLQRLSTTNRDLYKTALPDGYTILEHYLNAIPMPKVQDKNEKHP